MSFIFWSSRRQRKTAPSLSRVPSLHDALWSGSSNLCLVRLLLFVSRRTSSPRCTLAAVLHTYQIVALQALFSSYTNSVLYLMDVRYVR